MECLAETLWDAQRAGAAPDEARYMARVRRIAGQVTPTARAGPRDFDEIARNRQ